MKKKKAEGGYGRGERGPNRKGGGEEEGSINIRIVDVIKLCYNHVYNNHVYNMVIIKLLI